MDQHSLLVREARIDWSGIAPDSYLRRIDALAGVERIGFTRPVTFFVGENGSGKSTLLEAIPFGSVRRASPGAGHPPVRLGLFPARGELL